MTKWLIAILIFIILYLFVGCLAEGHVAEVPCFEEVKRPPKINENDVWIEGNWIWNRNNHLYTHSNGYWHKHLAGRAYSQGYWQQRPRGLHWVLGYWH